MKLYGIPTCDTCRKARAALTAAGYAVEFRDVRAEPLTEAEIARFLGEFGDAVLNRSSTTWRGLSETERALSPADLLATHPTVMKRPVIDTGTALVLGWTPSAQSRVLT